MGHQTDIVNMALGLIGEDQISTFGDTDTKAGRFSTFMYPRALDEVLTTPGIKFHAVKKRAGPIAAVTDQPLFGWDYAFQIPSDCMRVISLLDGLSNEDVPLKAAWIREGNYILTNVDECFIHYVARPDEALTSFLSPLTLNAITVNLAAKLAGPLTHDLELAREMRNEYLNAALPAAIADNQSEGYVANEQGAQDWTDAGR